METKLIRHSSAPWLALARSIEIIAALALLQRFALAAVVEVIRGRLAEPLRAFRCSWLAKGECACFTTKVYVALARATGTRPRAVRFNKRVFFYAQN